MPTGGNFVLRCRRCKGTMLECHCTARQMLEFDQHGSDRAALGTAENPMPESTYDKIRKQECRWCANGSVRLDPDSSNPYHRFSFGVYAGPCTAPSHDQVIDRLTSALERASVFDFNGDVTVCRSRQRNGVYLWAIRRSGFCLAKDGEWEWEPLPSSRDDEFLMRCRFSSYEESLSALAALDSKEQVKTDAE